MQSKRTKEEKRKYTEQHSQIHDQDHRAQQMMDFFFFNSERANLMYAKTPSVMPRPLSTHADPIARRRHYVRRFLTNNA